MCDYMFHEELRSHKIRKQQHLSESESELAQKKVVVTTVPPEMVGGKEREKEGKEGGKETSKPILVEA
jgi:hypothetical protein